jgi:hypothetical protein
MGGLCILSLAGRARPALHQEGLTLDAPTGVLRYHFASFCISLGPGALGLGLGHSGHGGSYCRFGNPQALSGNIDVGLGCATRMAKSCGSIRAMGCPLVTASLWSTSTL